jgi:hypothetical protein
MKTRASNVSSGRSRIPLWLKIAWTAWLLIWAPVYFRQYGAQNFLFFCDLGNLLIAAALWLESRVILSWQAVVLLVFQTLYAVDYVGALLLGRHFIGGTEYMFDPSVPVLVRALGLYHLLVPLLLLWAIHRLGYDPQALEWATLECWIVVPINFFWRASYNVNWARGLGHEQHIVPMWVYLLAYLIAVPLAVYWPTHLFLKWWTGRSRHGFQRLAS